jgi:hypothetical protein
LGLAVKNAGTAAAEEACLNSINITSLPFKVSLRFRRTGANGSKAVEHPKRPAAASTAWVGAGGVLLLHGLLLVLHCDCDDERWKRLKNECRNAEQVGIRDDDENRLKRKKLSGWRERQEVKSPKVKTNRPGQ